MNPKRVLLATMAGIALATASVTSAKSQSTTAQSPSKSASSASTSSSALSQWWNGSSALGNWFGLGYPLQDHGLTVTGSVKQDFTGQLTGGYSQNQPKSNWVNEEKLNALLNFGKLFNADWLEGLTFSSTWRYRNLGNNAGFAAGTASGPSSMFNPNTDTSGLGVRILPQYLQWQSDKTKDPRFMINLGWENPYEQFLQQPLSKDFLNNSLCSAKGIGSTLGTGIAFLNTTPNIAAGQTVGNGYPAGTTLPGTSVKYFNTSGVGWSSSYASWGGTLRVKPTRETYVLVGLYQAISQANGIGATQFSATQVYPYTQVPSSLKGAFNSTGLVYQQVGANGQPLYNANGSPKLAASGYIPGYNQNHGFNFQGSPRMNVNGAAIGATSVVNQNTGTVTPAANYGGNGGYNSMNGLFNMNEIGWTPKFGADKLAGKYVIGSYIWGQENTSFQPTSMAPATFNSKGVATYTPYNSKTPYSTAYNSLQWGMYFQADQRLYAVKEGGAAHAVVSGGKNPVDGKNPVAPATPAKVTDKGLYMFNEFTFTTPQNCAMPFYFQTGLVYKGLLPHRDNDQLGVALGAGFYSSYYNAYLKDQNQKLVNALGSSQNATVPNGPSQVNPATGVSSTANFYGAYVPMFSSTEVIEAYYKIQVNKWASIVPDVQYIINPAGNGTLGNEWILGGYLKMTF